MNFIKIMFLSSANEFVNVTEQNLPKKSDNVAYLNVNNIVSVDFYSKNNIGTISTVNQVCYYLSEDNFKKALNQLNNLGLDL